MWGVLVFDHYRFGGASGLTGSADDALIRLNDDDLAALIREDSHRAGL
jgi:hypothetical protein